MDLSGVKDVWHQADAVCFDVDSTVCTDEGIDELAAFLDVGEQVAKLTKEAMAGSMTFRESLSQRMQILNPSHEGLQRFLANHKPSLTPGIKELVDLLHSRSIPVYLISGGFHSIISPVADLLSIPTENIYANKMMFYHDGSYAGFDVTQLTSESGGKPRVISELKNNNRYKNLVHIGDGATDMEAAPPADAFIGFGGNVVRDSVKNGAAWFVYSIQEMIDELK